MLENTEFWIQLIVQGGAMAGLLFFLYLFITKVLPRFLDELNKQRTEFISAITNSNDKFEQTLVKVQDKHSEAVDNLSARLTENTQALNNVCRHRSHQL